MVVWHVYGSDTSTMRHVAAIPVLLSMKENKMRVNFPKSPSMGTSSPKWPDKTKYGISVIYYEKLMWSAFEKKKMISFTIADRVLNKKGAFPCAFRLTAGSTRSLIGASCYMGLKNGQQLLSWFTAVWNFMKSFFKKLASASFSKKAWDHFGVKS